MNRDKANQYKSYFRGLLKVKDRKCVKWYSVKDNTFHYNMSRIIGNVSITTTVEIFETISDYYAANVSATAHRMASIEQAGVLSKTWDLEYRMTFNDNIPLLDDLENEVISLIKKIGWL